MDAIETTRCTDCGKPLNDLTAQLAAQAEVIAGLVGALKPILAKGQWEHGYVSKNEGGEDLEHAFLTDPDLLDKVLLEPGWFLRFRIDLTREERAALALAAEKGER